MPRACAVRNCFQVGPVRRGAVTDSGRRGGSATPWRRRSEWPSLTSSPCTRRCPHAGFWVVMRITSSRTAAAAGGRPGAPPAGVAPRACGQSPVPGKQRRRDHRGTPTAAARSPEIVPPATAGRPAGSGPGWPGGAAPRSRAAAPAVRRPWTLHPGPSPQHSRADSERVRGRSSSDDGSRQGSHARSSIRAPQDYRRAAERHQRPADDRTAGTRRRDHGYRPVEHRSSAWVSRRSWRPESGRRWDA